VLPGDDYPAYQLPVHRFVQSELQEGRFPLWMPQLGGGMPVHAGQQAAITYPLLTPLLLLTSVNHALRLALFLHLLLGFWGQYRLGRRLKLSRAGASFAAALVPLGGFTVNHLVGGHINLILAMGLLPWLFVALSYLLERPGPLPAAALALVAGLLLLTGHPQVPCYGLALGFLWGLGSLIGGRGAAQRLRVIGWTMAAGATALLLVLIQWLPALELLADGGPLSPRSQSDYWTMGATRRIDLLSMLVPFACGNWFTGVAPFRTPPWAIHENCWYLGGITLVLALAGFTCSRQRPWQWGLLALCALALLIALGNNLPLEGGSLLPWLPGVVQFRCHGRLICVVTLFAGLLAGRGLDGLLGREPLPGRGVSRALMTAVLLLGVGILAGMVANREFLYRYLRYVRSSPMVAQEYLVGCMLLMTTAAALVIAWRLGRRTPHLAGFLLIATVCADLECAQGHIVRLVPARWPGESVLPVPAAGRIVPDSDNIIMNAIALRYGGLCRLVVPGGFSTPATNEGGVLPASLERLHTRLADPRTREQTLELAACDYLCDPQGVEWFWPVCSLPRIRLETPQDRQARELAETEGKREGKVLSCVEQTQEIRLTTDTPGPDRLIVADCYYPGWQAEIDGQVVPIEIVHDCFLSVRVPAGRHDLRLFFRSVPFLWGVAGSFLGLLLLAGLGIAGLRRLAVAPVALGVRSDQELLPRLAAA